MNLAHGPENVFIPRLFLLGTLLLAAGIVLMWRGVKSRRHETGRPRLSRAILAEGEGVIFGALAMVTGIYIALMSIPWD